MRTIKELALEFPGTVESGLSAAAVTNSRERFGGNRLTPLPRQPLWQKFLQKFDEPIIKILLAAALISLFVDLFKVNPPAGGAALGVVAALLGTLYLSRKRGFLPAVTCGSALAVFAVALAVPPHHPSLEGLAVMIAVVLATGVAFASEYKSDREFEVLNAHKDGLRVKVVRDGSLQTIPLEEVVVADAVVLEMGDEVPADGRVVRATDLLVDQSLMTGEAEPVPKQARPVDDTCDGPEQPGCLYRGTQVVGGVGRFLVTEAGDATMLGQLARRLSLDEATVESTSTDREAGRIKRKLSVAKELTPLQLKLQRLAALISKVGYLAATAIFLTLVARGLWFGELRLKPQLGETFGGLLAADSQALLRYFVYTVIIIVVAVPEGLPMSVTVSLALAMRKMTRANSLVRQLAACETIGSATVICTDKTGTLTQNKMQVVRLFWDGTAYDRGRPDWPAQETHRPLSAGLKTPLDWITVNAAVNSTAGLEEKAGKTHTVGNLTEGSLLHWLRDHGLAYARLRLEFEPLYQIHFSSERKRMTTVTRQRQRLIVLAKGAPEWVLAQSTDYLAADGSVRPWNQEALAAVTTALQDAARRAMRTLAFGHAVLPADTPNDVGALHACRDALETNLVFAGFVAIQDPLRDDVKHALTQCRAAGIDVKIITGDNIETARAIACDIGLVERSDAAIDTADAVLLTSPVFNLSYDRLRSLTDRAGLSDLEQREREAISNRLAGLRVLARARPLDKYKLVELLQRRQHVVAVTGDGTNDAPALRKADVGLSMGIAGTEVAKEASKIVLLDDAFSTIVKAVHWGRALYENIQRFVQFQLTINVSALTIVLLGPIVGVLPPFTVLQLLWLNVIMDTLASIALCSEPPRPGLLRVPPKRKTENIVTPAMAGTILATAAFFVSVMMTLLAGMAWAGWFRGQGQMSDAFPELSVRQVSIFFTLYVFFQVWNQVNCRSLTPEESGLKGLFGNPTFLVIAFLVAVVQVLIVNVPVIAAIFKVEPLGWLDWLIILFGSASVLVFAEIVRRLRRLGNIATKT